MKKFLLVLGAAALLIGVAGNNGRISAGTASEQPSDSVGVPPGPTRALRPVVMSYYFTTETLNAYFNVDLGTVTIDVSGYGVQVSETVNTANTQAVHIPVSFYPGAYIFTVSGNDYHESFTVNF